MMTNEQTIDFKVIVPISTQNFILLASNSNSGYSDQYGGCWAIQPNNVGYINFKLILPRKQGVIFTFELATTDVSGDNPVTLSINSQPVDFNFNPEVFGFDKIRLSVSHKLLIYGENKITITNSGTIKNSMVYLREASVDIYQDPIAQPNWMAPIHDNTLIGNINIPGTHDSAAIQRILPTFYACQNYSIRDQLKFGVRALDVRLEVTSKMVLILFLLVMET